MAAVQRGFGQPPCVKGGEILREGARIAADARFLLDGLGFGRLGGGDGLGKSGGQGVAGRRGSAAGSSFSASQVTGSSVKSVST
jgi:hypothetical protein